MAASATFALKAGVWFRRGRLLMISPDSRGTACPPSGRNSTYRPVQISEASSFGDDVDFAQLVKIYGKSGSETGVRRYSPPECLGAVKTPVYGEPDPKNISTSFAERANLTMRMNMRRFTRLTNAFSKKVENHAHAVALHMMYYNFVRIHKTLKVTPAMAAGVTDRLWEVADMVAVLEAWEAI